MYEITKKKRGWLVFECVYLLESLERMPNHRIDFSILKARHASCLPVECRRNEVSPLSPPSSLFSFLLNFCAFFFCFFFFICLFLSNDEYARSSSCEVVYKDTWQHPREEEEEGTRTYNNCATACTSSKSDVLTSNQLSGDFKSFLFSLSLSLFNRSPTPFGRIYTHSSWVISDV